MTSSIGSTVENAPIVRFRLTVASDIIVLKPLRVGNVRVKVHVDGSEHDVENIWGV